MVGSAFSFDGEGSSEGLRIVFPHAERPIRVQVCVFVCLHVCARVQI